MLCGAMADVSDVTMRAEIDLATLGDHAMLSGDGTLRRPCSFPAAQHHRIASAGTAIAPWPLQQLVLAPSSLVLRVSASWAQG